MHMRVAFAVDPFARNEFRIASLVHSTVARNAVAELEFDRLTIKERACPRLGLPRPLVVLYRDCASTLKRKSAYVGGVTTPK